MSAHFLDIKFQRDVVDCLFAEARFEHEAVHGFAEPGGDSINHSYLKYLELDYVPIFKGVDVAFVARGAHRIELVRNNVPEHIGYVFPYGDAGRDLFHEQITELKEQVAIWEVLDSGTDSSRSFVLFRHRSTDLVLQILHRERPLFPGIEW
jgi:hypothetical protein